MRGHRDIGVALHADRAGLALLLAMVLFAASLATALSATAAEKGRSGGHGKSASHGNSDSHGKSAGEDDDDGPEDKGKDKGKGKDKDKDDKGNGKGKGPDKNEEPSLPDEDGDDDDDDGDGDGDGDQVLGTRLVRTRVTLTWRNGAFRGRVFSRRDRCEAGRTVNVKRRNGTLIGRDMTNRRGRFSVPARKQIGHFRARAGRKVYRVPARDLRVVCLADRSLLRIKAINN